MSNKMCATGVYKIPALLVRESLEEDVRLFNTFLRHPNFPGHRKMILDSFPSLKSAIDNNLPEQENFIVETFVSNFYHKNKKTITNICKDAQIRLNAHGGPALLELFNVMNFKYTGEPKKYVAIATILPFSPFGKDMFYFSILGRLFGKSKKDILFIALHEISHLILRNILAKKYGRELEKELGWINLHILQEILAPILLNQDTMRHFIGMGEYMGNQFLHSLYLSEDNETLNIVQFYKNKYENMKLGGLTFSEIVDQLLALTTKLAPQLQRKMELWNTYGREIFASPDKPFATEYRTPIFIKTK